MKSKSSFSNLRNEREKGKKKREERLYSTDCNTKQVTFEIVKS